jgi:hypothetical protein
MRRLTPIEFDSLSHYLDHDAAALLDRYFNSDTFSGGRFERFAGGGDQPNVSGRFTSDDIVAVSLLSVRIPGRPALCVLETLAIELNALLAAIPDGVDLWETPEENIAPDSPADRLWHRLVDVPGIGAVTAGKLLARKRPRLIPVYDRVVKAALGRADEDEWWRPLRMVLVENPRLIATLESLRDAVRLDDQVSLLRVLDVCIWMGAGGEPEPTPDAET